MKKRLKVIFATMIAGTIIMSGCSSSQQTATSNGETTMDKANFKMSVTTSETSTWTLGAQKFADLVKEKTDGNITIEVFPNEQLSGGNQGKGVEMLSTGVIDISLHSNIIYSIMDERFGVISLPWILGDYNDIDSKLSGAAGDKVKEIAKEKGITVLAFGENGYRQITNNKKSITDPADMKGLKIRIPGIKMYTSLYKAFGADPITMSFSEVFTALQQNTIDGQENPTDVIASSKIDEVQNYLTIWDYSYDSLLLGFNSGKFDKLSTETQAIIMECAKEAMEYQRQVNRDKVTEQMAAFESTMVINTLTDEQREAFKVAAEPVYEEYKNIIGQETIDLFTK